MADRVGFEPTIPLQVCRISSAVPSTARPPVRRALIRKRVLEGKSLGFQNFLLVRDCPVRPKGLNDLKFPVVHTVNPILMLCIKCDERSANGTGNDCSERMRHLRRG